MEWITDRLPTEVYADENGDVCVQNRPKAEPSAGSYFHWKLVVPGMAWCRTDIWEAPNKPAPAPEPAPAHMPRRFVSISRTDLTNGDHILDAIDDGGDAWWKHSYQAQWTQHMPLPGRPL